MVGVAEASFWVVVLGFEDLTVVDPLESVVVRVAEAGIVLGDGDALADDEPSSFDDVEVIDAGVDVAEADGESVVEVVSDVAEDVGVSVVEADVEESIVEAEDSDVEVGVEEADGEESDESEAEAEAVAAAEFPVAATEFAFAWLSRLMIAPSKFHALTREMAIKATSTIRRTPDDLNIVIVVDEIRRKTMEFADSQEIVFGQQSSELDDSWCGLQT